VHISRREFLQTLAIASASGLELKQSFAGGTHKLKKTNSKNNIQSENMYEVKPYGNVSLIHMTDVHAQLTPLYYREANNNITQSKFNNKPQYLAGDNLLKHYGIESSSPLAHALTNIDFTELAKRYGKMGGYAHITSLVKTLRAQRPSALLLDGGDNWQGSATSLWTNAQDMVDANKILGLDVMTGHWEFTYGATRVKEIIENDLKDQTDFVAHNVIDKDFGDSIFKPYVIKEQNGIPVAIIGQAFPYTAVGNPGYMYPKWSFGIREQALQDTINMVKKAGAEAIVLLSHNGLDVDLKLATRVVGLDAILGGHTHDALPKAKVVKNKSGKTLVINSGCAGKFVSLLDFNVRNKRVVGYQYKLLPVFSNLIQADTVMQRYIDNIRQPFLPRLKEELAFTNDLLYRRGTFNGSFDQIIVDALMKTFDADIAFSPGFRWGMSVLPGTAITYEDVMNQTAITYPVADVNYITGERIKLILEDVADNIFNPDPYYQQGGDMVRVGGLQYSINPTAKIGERISEMTLRGQPLQANKKYKVAGWAVVSEYLEGIPIWDVVANYLRDKKVVSIKNINTPKLKNS